MWLWLSVCRVCCWGAGLTFDGVPGYFAGEPGQCLWVCRNNLPGCRINLGLPGFVASVPVESAMMCCRCAGLMQENGWGHVGIPILGPRGWAGQIHSAMEPKFFSLLSML
jgi:hypothetical protein